MGESQLIHVILHRYIQSSMVAAKRKIISEKNLKCTHIWVGVFYCLNLLESSCLHESFISISRGSSKCWITSEHKINCFIPYSWSHLYPLVQEKKIQLKILLHISAGISDYGDTKNVTIACNLLKNISKITAVNCNLNILAAPELPSPERALFN